MNRISLDKSGQKAVDDYLEYKRFVLILSLLPSDSPCSFSILQACCSNNNVDAR